MKRVCDNVAELFCAKTPPSSMAQFGRDIGVSTGTVNAWIKGKNDPNAAVIPLIARWLDVSIERLFEGVS